MRRRVGIAVLVGLALPSSASAAITANNPVVYRVGQTPGGSALTATATPVFLDEFSPTGAPLGTTNLPTAAASGNRPLFATGNQAAEGLMTRSGNGGHLIVTGYDSTQGGSAQGSDAMFFPRVIGKVTPDGSVDTTFTSQSLASGGHIRSAYSVDGQTFWATGSTTGLTYWVPGDSNLHQVTAALQSVRQVNAFGGQLYISAPTNLVDFRLGSVGTGLPTSENNSIQNLPGYPGTTGSPFAFYMADLSPAVPGLDVLYAADDGAGQILKYSLVSGTWIANGSYPVTNVHGLTGRIGSGGVTLYATNPTNLFKATDTSGYNAAPSNPPPASIATAPANTAFRGVALGPGTPASVTSAPASHGFGDVTVGTSSAAQTFTVGNGGAIDMRISSLALTGNNTSQFAVSGDTCTGTVLAAGQTCTVNATFSPTSEGDKSAVLRISSDAPGGPKDVALSGRGLDPPPAAGTGTGTAADPGTTSVPGAGTPQAGGGTAITPFAVRGLRSCKAGSATLVTTAPGLGVLTVTSKSTKSVSKAVDAAGKVNVGLRLTRSAKSKLAKRRQLKAQLAVKFKPPGATALKKSVTIKLKKKGRKVTCTPAAPR